MRYAQISAGNKLHMACEPGEEYRGQVVRAGQLSAPLCGTPVPDGYRMNINVPLGATCQRCARVLRSLRQKEAGHA